MSTTPITNGYELIHPDYYGANGPPYAIWDRLRAESPVHWCEVEDVEHLSLIHISEPTRPY